MSTCHLPTVDKQIYNGLELKIAQEGVIIYYMMTVHCTIITNNKQTVNRTVIFKVNMQTQIFNANGVTGWKIEYLYILLASVLNANLLIAFPKLFANIK